MTAREIIAYAITHAPRGVKGGPYEAIGGDMGDTCERLSASLRWPVDNPVDTAEEVLEEAQEFLAEEIAPKVPHARVIRIVRKARPSRLCDACGFLIEAESRRRAPSEASAVEVLRELVAVLDRWNADTLPMSRMLAACTRIEPKARRVLAAAGPDPSEVVRAACEYMALMATKCPPDDEGAREACIEDPDALAACERLVVAVDAYRTLAALDDEYQAAVAATKGEGE